MNIEEGVPLAPLTTFRIGGAARYFVRVRSLEELREALAFARSHAVPFFILGGGSNILVSDEGYDGLIIKMEMKGTELIEDAASEKALLIAAAGERWDDLVAYAVAHDLWGLENLSGIPGTVGASPVQNIGAYRMSIFKQQAGRFIILRAVFSLSREGAPNLSYRDLREAFAEKPQPSLAQVREAILAIRARKFPDLRREGTAGSFFLNPTVSAETAARLRLVLPDMPHFPTEKGIKIPLAYLLDHGLDLRGFALGGARLFESQPLVLVARFGTPSAEVQALVASVQAKIRGAYGIEIECEVKML